MEVNKNMASVRQKNGKWYYRITLTVGDGSHKYIERGSWTSKKEALEAGKEAEKLLKHGDMDERRKNLSFSFLSEEWLSTCDKRYKPRSIMHYKEMLNKCILPVLGDYNIHAISVRQCQSIIDASVNRRKSFSRVSHIKIVMCNVFKYAIQQGYMRENPAKNVILPAKRTKIGQSLNCRSGEKVVSKELLEAIFKRFPEGSSIHIPLLLGYRAGLRLGEVFGLLVQDFDYQNRVLHIRRQVQYDDKSRLYFTNPKYCDDDKGRDVSLDLDTCNVIKRHLDEMFSPSFIRRMKRYYVDQNGFINEDDGIEVMFLNTNLLSGRMMAPHNMAYTTRVIHGRESHMDVTDPNWCFHHLRHTHASECLAAGMSPVSVQKRLGHRSLNTTFKTYIHETETQVTESRSILEKMFI